MLPFIALLKKSSLLFALLITIGFTANAQGLFTPVASAVNTGGNCYRLTTETVSDRGAIWNNTKISLLSNFDISYTFNFGTRSGYSGGDGMAFVLQPAGLSQIGVAGSAKGYGNNYDGNGNIVIPGISPSVVVEYDNYDDNGGTNALLSLLFNGDYRRTNPDNVGVPQQSIGFVNDGLDHTQRVTWNASTKTMTVYTDGVQRFTYTRDFVTDIFSGQDEVYFGFTAATGGSVNQYSVCYNAELSTFESVLIPSLGQIFDACAGGSTGSATIHLQGGTNPFIIELNGVSHVFTQSNITSSSVTFSNLPADVYSVRILESNGFVNNDLSFTIDDNPTPIITASGPLTLCTDSTVTLTASPDGIAYLWNNGATTQSITVSAAGTYDVEVTYTLGCGPAATAAPTIVTTVQTPNFPDISSTNQSGYLCAGETTVINITNVEPGVTYQWYYAVSGGFAFMQPIPGETGTSITVNSIGQYAVKASKNCGTIFSMGYQFNAATLQPPPTITASGATTFCAGGSVTLTSSSPIGNTWSTGETTPSITVSNSGSYSVTLFSGNCASTSVPTVVTVNPSPVTPSFFALNTTEFCEGGSLTITVANVQPGVSYQWLKAVGVGFANPMPGETGTSLLVTSEGRYTVMASNSCGAMASGTYQIFVNPKPIISAVTGITTICSGSTTTLTASSPSFGSTFLWSEVIIGGGVFGSNARVVVGAGSVFTTPALSANATYEVMATDLNGCESVPQTVNVTVNPAITTPTITASVTTVCTGATTTISVTNIDPSLTYQWYKDGIIINGATGTTYEGSPGNYQVFASDGSCSAFSTSLFINERFVTAPLDFTVTSLNSCGGPNNGMINQGPFTGGGFSYVNLGWTGPNGFFRDDVSMLSNLAAGTYTLGVRDFCGTVVSKSVTILEPAPQPQTMAVSGPTTLCNPESSVTIMAYAGAASYIWQRIVEGVTIPVSGSTNSINATEPGAYYVSMTDAAGCFQNSNLVDIYAANPIPLTASTTIINPYCNEYQKGTIDISYSGGTGAITFNGWSDGNSIISMNTFVSNLEPGSYTASYTDACGFTVIKTVTIVTAPAASTPTITASAPFCGNNSVTLTLSPTPYSFVWYKYDDINDTWVGDFSANQSTVILPPDPGFFYGVSVKDDNNCYLYPEGFSTVQPTPITFSVYSNPSCYNNTGNAGIFNLSGGKSPITYSWTDGGSFNSTSASLSNLAPGTYTVTAIDACANAVSQTVTITGGVTAATITTTTQNVCAGSSALLSITNYNAAYTYQWTKDGVIIPGATAASYIATEQGGYNANVSNGSCDITSNFLYITIGSPLTVNINSNATSCVNGGGYASANTVGGVGPFTFLGWTGPNGYTSNSNNIGSLGVGTYTATYQDFCGNQASASVTINPATPVILPTITASKPYCVEGESVVLTLGPTAYSFAWVEYDPSNIAQPYIWAFSPNQSSITVTKPGVQYYVVHTDANNCNSFSQGQYFNTNLPTPITFSVSSSPSCGTNTGTANVFNILGGKSPVTYAWSDGASFNSTNGFITNLAPGTYTVTLTDACANVVSQSVNITGGVAAAVLTTTATSICSGSTAELSITNVDLSVSYQWKRNGLDIVGATSTTYSATLSGSYSVAASKNGCTSFSSSRFISVLIPSSPLSISVTSTNSCFGPNVGSARVSSVTGGISPYTYSWTNGAGFTNTASNIGGLAAGVYTVTVRDFCGTTVTQSATIIQTVAPVVSIATSGSTTICAGESVTLTANTTGTAASYRWSWADNGSINNSIATTQSYTVSNGGTYIAFITDLDGCTRSTGVNNAANVIVTQPRTPNVIADGPTTLCPNGSVNLTATDISNQTKYSLKFNGSNYVEAPHLAAMGLTARLSVEAWFKTDNASITQYIVSKGTNDYSPGQYGLVLSNGKVELHLSMNSLHHTVQSTTNIQAGKWYHAVGTWDSTMLKIYINGVEEAQAAFVGPMTANTQPLEIGRLGTFAPYNFLGEIDEVRIWNIALSAAQINAQKGTIINYSNNMVANYRFEEGTGTTAADNGFGNPATLYGSPTWTPSTAPFYNYTPTYLWNPGEETSSTFNVNAAGSYTVTVNAGGCTNTSAPIAITTLPIATINASGSLSLLPGQTVTLTASAGTAFLWSNGATTQSIVVGTAELGTYTVTVTDINCTTTSLPTTVSSSGIAPVINVPSTITVNNDPGTCGAIVNFTATETTGVPASTITYSHTPGSLFPIGTTIVTVTATNSVGVSTGTFNITVTDNEKPIFVVTAPGTATVTIPAMQTFVGSCQMIPFNFLDPLPAGAVVTGIDLNYSGQDQGYGYTDGNDDLYVSGTKVASSVYAHETKTFNTTYTGPIPGYVYGGNNVFGFVFTCYPGWQGFINGGTMTIRYTSSFGPKTINSDAGKCDATLTLTAPNTSDNCGVASVTNDAPATFPLGTTNVTWTVSDINGNNNTISQTVTVVDNQAPVVTTQNITVQLSNGTVSITPSQINNGSTDNCGIASYSLDKTSFDCSNVGSNTVTLTITDNQGNSASGTAIVMVQGSGSPATVSASGPTTFCSGGSVTLTASAGTSYLWSSGETTQSITVSTAGSYTVTVSDASGCSVASAPIVVSVNGLPIVNITAAGPTTFCAGGSVALTVSGSSGNGNALTFNGANRVTVNNTPTIPVGNSAYTMEAWIKPKTVSGANGLLGWGNWNAINQVNAIRFEGPTTLINYWWTNDLYVTIPNVLDGQWHHIAATYNGTTRSMYMDGVLLGSDAPTGHNVPSGTTMYIGETNPAGNEYFDGAMDEVRIWNVGKTQAEITAAMNSTIPANSAGLVAYYKMDEGTGITTADITGNNNTGTLTGSPVWTIPSTSPVTSGFETITWSPSGATTASFTATTSGNYAVTVTNASGCSATSTITTVTVNPAPVVNPIVTAGGPTTICAGDNVSLSVSSIAGNSLRFNGSNYLEAPSAPGNSLSTALTLELWFKTNNAGAVQYLVSKGLEDGSPGHYGLVLVNGGVQLHLGGAGSASINSVTKLKSNIWYHVAATWDGATGNAKLYLNGVFEGQVATGVNSNLGTNTEPLQIGRLGKPCCPYLFQGEMDEIRIWNVARDVNQIVNDRSLRLGATPNLVANYHFDEGSGTITNDSAPAGSNATLVNNPTWQVSGAPINPSAATYLWSNGATTPTINASAAGSYSATVTYITPEGCTATGTSAPFTVSEFATTASITASGSLALCFGGSVVLTANAGTAYLWSNGANTQSITVNAAGNYSVTVTNANGCSASSAITTVTVNAPAVSPTISTSGLTTFCAGGSVTLTSSSATGNVWSTGATSQSITVSQSGNYSVTATDGNGCSAISTNTTVTVNTPPVVSISAGGPTSFCNGGSVTLTSSSATGNVWSTNETSQSITVTASGNYTVTVTDGNGCSAISAGTVVNANSAIAPVITANGATSFCTGGSVTLTSSATSGNVWSNGATTQSITVNQTGNYSVIVTDVNGCSAGSNSITVTNNPLPVAIIATGGPTTICEGGSVTLTSNTATGNLWSNGATSQSITLSQTAIVSLTVTDANGCSTTTGLTTVTVNPLPVVTISASGPTSFCPGGLVILSSSAGSGNVWSNGGSTNAAITVSTSGNYSVTQTDANGCAATSNTITVTAEDIAAPVPDIAVLSDLNILPNGTIVPPTATDNCTGGVIIGVPDNLPAELLTGTYTITWTFTDAAGNASSQIQILNVQDNTPPSLKVANEIIKNNDPGTCGALVQYELPVAIDNVSTNTISVSEGGGDGTITFDTKLTNNVSSIDFISTGEFQDIVHGHGANINVRIELYNPLDDTWTLIKVIQTGTGDLHLGGSSINFPTINRVSKLRFIADQFVGAAFHLYELSINLNSIAIVQRKGLPSGSVFPIGSTLNEFEAIDIAGNIATTSFTVTVLDNELPVISGFQSIKHNAAANCSWTGSAATIISFDNCPVQLLLTEQCFDNKGNRFYNGQSSIAQGAYVLPNRTFPVGVNTVVLSLTDASGKVSQLAKFNVTVEDVTAPTIVSSGNIVQKADPGVCAAYVKVPLPTIGDNCSIQSVANSFNKSPSAADRYPVGVTNIIWTITDASGNKSTTTQTVTVLDQEAPVIFNVPVDINVTNNPGTCGALVSWDPLQAADNCSGIQSFTSDHIPGEVFPIGETTVTYTAIDRFNNVGTVSFTITVTDNEAPRAITRPVTVTLVNGAASIQVSAINNGSFDNCSAVTVTASKINFTCNDIGVNDVILSVTDIYQNVSTAIAKVTVLGEKPSSTIVATPNSAVYTGGEPTNLYLGYGPTALTLTANVANSTPVTYAWSGSNGLSSRVIANPSFAPTAAGSYEFTVVATNQYGCTTTASVTVCVRDIRTTGGVSVCRTDNNTGNTTTLTVTTGQVANLLASTTNLQYKLGACGMPTCSPVAAASEVVAPITAVPAMEGKVKGETPTTELKGLTVTASPNPTNDVFKIVVNAAKKAPTHIRLLSENGRVQESKNNIMLGTPFTMGETLHSGVYFAEVIQGKDRVVLKLIKLNR